MATRYVLDTSLLLGGRDPPRDGSWHTTPEAAAEIRPGGRDARRYAIWMDLGLRVESAPDEAHGRVMAVAESAGNLGRLSAADRSLLALTWHLGQEAVLVTDDHTILDVARRMDLRTQTVATRGITGTMDWRPRCAGCGRWFEAMPADDTCPVCGSPVRAKPRRS